VSDRIVNPRLAILADMCRANALATVKRAGSGHLGSSFSSLDVVTYLYEEELNVVGLGVEHPDRDIYFSSKGHDAPGQYAVLHAVGLVHALHGRILASDVLGIGLPPPVLAAAGQDHRGCGHDHPCSEHHLATSGPLVHETLYRFRLDCNSDPGAGRIGPDRPSEVVGHAGRLTMNGQCALLPWIHQ